MFRDKLVVEGILPERAILRIKRAGIAVYNAKKIRNTAILFSVKKKDVEKVFAIYPNVCYNKENVNGYAVARAGAERTGRAVDFFKKRFGILLGILVFYGCVCFLDSYVFRVQIVGTSIYEREIQKALEKNGVKRFSRYDDSNLDLICSEILSLDGVGFCSVKKSGTLVKVEVRMNSFQKLRVERGEMRSAHTGEIVSLSVMRGTPLKKAGDSVQVGETIVGDYLIAGVEGEKRTTVDVIARVKIACEYQASVQAETAEEAFCMAYLSLDLSERGEIQEKSVVQAGDSFCVKLKYTEIQTINF